MKTLRKLVDEFEAARDRGHYFHVERAWTALRERLDALIAEEEEENAE